MFPTGSALYQIQNGKPKLTAYASKRLPVEVRNYSITRIRNKWIRHKTLLVLSHLLKRVDFDAIVDHLVSTCILKVKGKAELATTRIKRLLEILSSYSFNSYRIKGKGYDTSVTSSLATKT